MGNHNADLAHLVERDLAKVEVAGSSPVIRSKKPKPYTEISLYGFRRHSQVVRQRSAKPLFPSSNLGDASKKLSFFEREFFYPSRQAWYIITTQSCISLPHKCGVYHHTFRCVLKICRLDDIQNFVLMICNSYGIDDIQCFALICCRFYAMLVLQ